MKISLDETAGLLEKAQKIIITAHINPDGDAVGSSLGLGAFLMSKGKEVRIYIDDKLPRNLSFLPGYDLIKRLDDDRFDADLAVILDTDMGRIGAVSDLIIGKKTLNIDHHISNDGKADYVYIEKRAATAEMVFEIIDYVKAEIPLSVALPLYTGLATDTGFFKFSNTRSYTMMAAARLIDCGVKPNGVSEALEQKPLSVVEGEIEALKTLTMAANGRIAGIFLDYELSSKIESTEGFIDLIRVIEGVDVAVMIKGISPNVCRASIRSKGFDVSKIAMKFGGGGHIRAAGCTLNMPLEEAKKMLLDSLVSALEENK